MEEKRFTVRTYGTPYRVWRDDFGRLEQTEFRYYDYNEKGELIAQGTEDFSPEREEAQMCTAWFCVWDGSKRNKGGHRWFNCLGTLHFRRGEGAKVCKAFLEKHKTLLAYENNGFVPEGMKAELRDTMRGWYGGDRDEWVRKAIRQERRKQ